MFVNEGDDSQHSQRYADELTNKKHYLQQKLQPFFSGQIDIFASEPTHYRLRAEFRIWHDDDGLHYVMTPAGEKANPHTVIRTPQLPHASEDINRLMPALLDRIANNAILSRKLFQIEFLNTLSNDMLVTLIYHRQLDDEWLLEAQPLAESLNIQLIGRARKQKLVLNREYVTETFNVLGRDFHYRQYEGGFTQPNGHICQTMLNWTAERVKQLRIDDTDLLELYCGNGNFTLPLSPFFRQVLATEISKTSVKALRENIELNDIKNIKVARLSAEKFNVAFKREREFRRLKQDNIALDDYHFSTIFVDPPRAGIDEETLNTMQTFAHIIYISCNPDTLATNLAHLTTTHSITSVALFDQFPDTKHIETGVLLCKNK